MMREPPLVTSASLFPLEDVTQVTCDIVLVSVIWCIEPEIDTLHLITRYPDTGPRDTGDTTGATFLCPLTVRVRSWTMNRSNKCRPDTHIVFIWMFVGEIHLSEAVAGESRLIMRGRGQASNNVTFISQPPSNQMSLFPTYLITVLIYGIISYQTQNLPQLKLWQSGPLPSLYEGFVCWVTFYIEGAPSCLTVTPQTGNKNKYSQLDAAISRNNQWVKITTLDTTKNF